MVRRADPAVSNQQLDRTTLNDGVSVGCDDPRRGVDVHVAGDRHDAANGQGGDRALVRHHRDEDVALRGDVDRIGAQHVESHRVRRVGRDVDVAGCHQNGVIRPQDGSLRQQVDLSERRCLQIAQDPERSNGIDINRRRRRSLKEVDADRVVGLERVGVVILPTFHQGRLGVVGLLPQPAATGGPVSGRAVLILEVAVVSVGGRVLE